MTAQYFVDTNVLVYARDSKDPEKQQQAQSWLAYLWRNRSGVLSYQVLQEYYQTVTRKLNPPMDSDAARADIRDVMAWKPIVVDLGVLEKAWSVEQRFQLSWWDSLIVAAAIQGECSHLLTEDLQHAQQIDKLIVCDPFQSTPPQYSETSP